MQRAIHKHRAQPTHFFKKIHTTCFTFLMILMLSGISTMLSAQFTPGRLVVVQTSNSGNVKTTSSAITLKEFKTDGTAGISLALPSGSYQPIQIAAGASGSEGFLTTSTDGSFLILGGFSVTGTTTTVSGTASSTVKRVLYTVNAAGVATKVDSTTNYTGNDIRGGISDGTNYWAAGASNTGEGISYMGPGTPVSLGVNPSNVGPKAYGLRIFNGNIYYATQKAGPNNTTSQLGIFKLNTGLPTTATVGTAQTTQIINAGTATPTDFSFSPDGNTCYVAINGGTSAGIQKWTSADGGLTYTNQYTLDAGVAIFSLIVDYADVNHPVLYATTMDDISVGNNLVKIVDNGDASSSTVSTIATAGAGNWMHGIAFAPTCPVLAQPGAFTASSATVNLGQTAVTYTVPNDASATSYTWSYSGTGATINGTGNSVTIDFAKNATAGTLSVYAVNACGNSTARAMNISIAGAIRITEFMYKGGGTGGLGEFVELTNVGGTAVDMTSWSFDDNSETPGSMGLGAFGTVQPGESVIFTEIDAATFRSNWHLCSGIKVIGNNTQGLGNGDEINIYDASNTLVDRLTYPGTGAIITSSVSAWVSLAGLGANDISKWTLSVVGDGEQSGTSTLGEKGSPGKSTMATVSFDACTANNSAPTIVINVTSTSNYLDGGVATSPGSPYATSGVLNDPTDPARTLGFDFTIDDPDTDVNTLTVTTSSSNTSVVTNTNVAVTGSGSSRNVKITPSAVGFTNITISVSDGLSTTSYILNYGASAASTTPASTVWHTGMSDASDGIMLDNGYFISGDDELDVLNVYSIDNSGLPAVSYDYTNFLGLDLSKPEVDLEAAASSPVTSGKIFWTGSMSNSKSPFLDRPNRNRIFATTVTGTGTATSFTMAGYYDNMRAKILAWGDSHGYDFTSSAAAGVDSKSPSGFAIESMVFGPDNTTLYIGLRAPLVPTATRDKAVIVPVTNFESWFGSGSPSVDPTFGNPIELDLGGRGFRDLIRLSNGTYLIIAGNPAGSPLTGAIYKWTGNASDAPVRVTSSGDNTLNMEGVLPVVESGKLSMSKLQVISDDGDDDLYNDGNEAKDETPNQRKFRVDLLTSLDLCMPLTSDTTASICDHFTWYGTNYTAAATPTHTLTSYLGCDSIVTLHLTISSNPVINANIDQAVCSSVITITLNGSASNTTSQTWSTSGTGTFSSASALNATYTPSTADISSGTVTLTLTSDNTGVCTSPVTDAMDVTFHTCTSIAGMTESQEIQLVPNPNSGNVVVQLSNVSEAASLVIYNVQGEKVRDLMIAAGATELNLELNDLKAGMYTIVLKDASGKQMLKRMIRN
ncbi:MAG TPA: lamin tail domain-containing protein [Cytophagaceae bacterium]|nr:lamin tail domain-containing protein [Cytophagaceae bacterium]